MHISKTISWYNLNILKAHNFTVIDKLNKLMIDTLFLIDKCWCWMTTIFLFMFNYKMFCDS